MASKQHRPYHYLCCKSGPLQESVSTVHVLLWSVTAFPATPNRSGVVWSVQAAKVTASGCVHITGSVLSELTVLLFGARGECCIRVVYVRPLEENHGILAQTGQLGPASLEDLVGKCIDILGDDGGVSKVRHSRCIQQGPIDLPNHCQERRAELSE